MHFRKSLPVWLSCVLAIAAHGFCSAAEAANATPPKASSSPARTGRTASLIRSLSLHDRLAQLIVVRGYGDYPPTDDAEYRRFTRWIREDHVGGFIVAGRIRNDHVISAQPFEMAAFINHMQRLAKTPLLVASDFERGASMRVDGTTVFPHAMAFGATFDPSLARYEGEVTAREARALGVQWVFFPVADQPRWILPGATQPIRS